MDVQDGTNCHFVKGFTEDTRIVVDKQYRHLLREDFPERFSPYIVAMAGAKQIIPWNAPPTLPAHLRKRKGVAEKTATWVASHLCHDRRCVNPEHLTFEPSWFNRIRDNCPGGELCVHRPKPCIRAHRPAGETINWEDYWESGLSGDSQAQEESQQAVEDSQRALEDLDIAD